MPDIFLLTKPPNHSRAKLCLKLLKRSANSRLYLCGDGIFCILNSLDDLLPPERIFICKEDMDARGVQAKSQATILDDFYEQLVYDSMDESDRVLTF